MANKKEEVTETISPVSRELNGETVQSQLKGMVEYHNNLVKEKNALLGKQNELLGQLQKVETEISESLGGIKTLHGLQKEHFVEDVPSVNGEV